MKEIANYEQYSKLNGADILEIMRDKPRAEIEEFQLFCSTPKETHEKPGFFEIRNWVLDKYYPGVRNPAPKGNLIDEIMKL